VRQSRLLLAGLPEDTAEPKVTVGGEGAHAKLVGERQRLPIEAFSVLGTAEGLGLTAPSPQPAVSASASRA
jgi:hypothetical protein